MLSADARFTGKRPHYCKTYVLAFVFLKSIIIIYLLGTVHQIDVLQNKNNQSITDSPAAISLFFQQV